MRLRLMLDLAMNGEIQIVVRIKDIAGKTADLRANIFEQIIIFSVLNKAGYVRSTETAGRLFAAKAPENTRWRYFASDGWDRSRRLPAWRRKEVANAKWIAYRGGCGCAETRRSAMSWIISHWRIMLHCRKRSRERAVLTLEKISELSYDT